MSKYSEAYKWLEQNEQACAKLLEDPKPSEETRTIITHNLGVYETIRTALEAMEKQHEMARALHYMASHLSPFADKSYRTSIHGEVFIGPLMQEEREWLIEDLDDHKEAIAMAKRMIEAGEKKDGSND